MMEQHFSYFNSQLNYSFHCSVLLEENCLPTLESILEMQQNKDCYFLFCDNFHSRIVGFTFWRDNCTKQKISEMATILDEAFAYLFIANYWDEWSTKNLDDYVGERCYNSSISKRKKEWLHGESTQRELGEHGVMLDGIRMEYFDLISYARK